MTTIHLNATVGPDGALDLHVPNLPPGAQVSITVEPDQPASLQQTSSVHIIDLIKDLPGQRLFKPASEVDEHLREERDAWERLTWRRAAHLYRH